MQIQSLTLSSIPESTYALFLREEGSLEKAPLSFVYQVLEIDRIRFRGMYILGDWFMTGETFCLNHVICSIFISFFYFFWFYCSPTEASV